MPKKLNIILATLFVMVSIGLYWRLTVRPDFDPAAVLAQVKQLNQLATVRYTVQKVVGLREQKEPLGAESILLILQARVEAGVDLASMGPGDVSVRPDRSVVIMLPRPQILNVAVDEKETKVWDRQKTWWTPWVPYSLDLEQRARIEGLRAARQAALDMGILGNAQQNAERSIHSLLGFAGVKNVVVLPAGSS
jgi:hypothetical protein